MWLLGLSDAGWAAIGVIAAALITGLFGYMGILASRASREQTNKANAAVDAVEADYEAQERMIGALETERAALEEQAERARERERRCLALLEAAQRRQSGSE